MVWRGMFGQGKGRSQNHGRQIDQNLRKELHTIMKLKQAEKLKSREEWRNS